MTNTPNNSPFKFFNPAFIQGKRVQSFFAYWQSKTAGSRLPLKEDIDILGLEDLIGLVSVIDVVNTSPRFSLRMIGSEIVHRSGQDNTGKFVDEIEDRTARSILQSSYKEVFDTREPFWVKRESILDGQLFVYECVIVPLTNNDGEITQLLSIVEYP